MRLRLTRLALLIVVPLVFAANGEAPLGAKPPQSAGTYAGFIYPSEHYKIYAPQNVFKALYTWMENSGIVVTYLAEDGATVKPGDVICEFEFRGNGYADAVQSNIKGKEADLVSIDQEIRRTSDRLKQKLASQAVDLQQKFIDKQKGMLFSALQAKLAANEYEASLVEYKHTKAIVEATTKNLTHERAAIVARLAEAQGDGVRFELFKKRHTILAEEEGIVRHVFDKALNRKIKKGDYLTGGTVVLSVAKNRRLAVEFFVDEPRFRDIKIGSTVKVRQPDKPSIDATIVSNGEFPQSLGFLHGNWSRPDAFDMAYQVFAEIGEIDSLQAGADVVVEF